VIAGGDLDVDRPRPVTMHDGVEEGLAEGLAANKDKILKELIDCQGKPVDIGGYFQLDDAKANAAMRPSPIFNALIDKH
jgi:monomeric isocitrate dehydrogenase